MGRSPYDAVAHLVEFAAAFPGYIRGRIRLGMLPPLTDMYADEACDIIEAIAVEQAGPGGLKRISDALLKPMWMTEETWGTEVESVAAVERMEAAMPLDTSDPDVAAYMERMRRGDTATTND